MEEEKKKKIILPIIWGVMILIIIVILVISNSKKNTQKNVAVNTDKVVQIDIKDKEEDKKPAEKKEIVLSKNSVILSVGGSETLTLTNDTSKKLTWYSTHPSIASVDSSGRVTAVSMGTAIITGQDEDGSEGNCTIIVKDGKVVTKKPSSSNSTTTKPSTSNTNNNNTYKPSTSNNNNNQNKPTYPNDPDEPVVDPNEPINPDDPIIDPDDPTEVVKCFVRFVVDGEIFTTKEVEEGTILGTLPDNPERRGYSFNGWYDGDIPVDSQTVITEDIIFEGKWDTYTFELALINNDSISPNRIVKAYKNGQSVDIKELFGTIGDNSEYTLTTRNERTNEVKCVSAEQVESASNYMLVLNGSVTWPVYANKK